jgi:hypothetical protein
LDELVECFDSQDWGDDVEQMPVVDFEVDIKRKLHLITLEAELADKVTEIAVARKTSPEALVNAWVREKILEYL